MLSFLISTPASFTYIRFCVFFFNGRGIRAGRLYILSNFFQGPKPISIHPTVPKTQATTWPPPLVVCPVAGSVVTPAPESKYMSDRKGMAISISLVVLNLFLDNIVVLLRYPFLRCSTK